MRRSKLAVLRSCWSTKCRSGAPFPHKSLKGTPATIHLYVDDVDAFVDLKMPVADMFWGDRYGVIVDPFGHNWSVATQRRDVSAEEIQEALKKLPTCGASAKA